jgi:hypothetical protein
MKSSWRLAFPKPFVAARMINFMKDVARLGYKKANQNHTQKFAYKKRKLVEAGLWRTYFAGKRVVDFKVRERDESFLS